MEDGNATARRVRGFAMPSAIFRLVILVILLIAWDNLTFVSSTNAGFRELLILVHRDGERNPDDIKLKFDRSREWPGAPGDLTPEGEMQLCNLGYIINIYCRDLFPKPESFSGINIRETSSSTERCIKGAESLLHCLPANMLDVHDRGTFVKQVIEKKMFDAKAFKKDTFVEKSVTADIIPKELDNILLQSMPCPKYDKMLREATHQFNVDHVDLYKELSVYMGEPLDTMNANRVREIYDALLVKRNALFLPVWAKHPFRQKLGALIKESNLLFTRNDYMKRIRGGYFLSKLFAIMKQRCLGEITHKVHFYSGDESSLVNLLSALGIISKTSASPIVGTALAFELFGIGSCDTWEIKMFYYRFPESPPERILIPGCNSPCQLRDFRKIVKNLWTEHEEYATACEIE